VVPEGLEVDWVDTLCRRALDSGVLRTDDVPERWADSEAAAALGIQTYASAPITRPDGEVVGTLCGISAERVEVGEEERQHASRRADAAEERLRARAEFLAVAEHKLKTPLAILTGWARTLQRDGLPSQMREKGLEVILATSARLNSDVEQLLRETTTEVVTANLDLHVIDLRPIVTEIVEDWDGSSEAHRNVLSAEAEVRACVDVRAVRIALEHLLENAIKYSPAGGDVEVALRSEGQDGAVLSVRDHGVGLPTRSRRLRPLPAGRPGRLGCGPGPPHRPVARHRHGRDGRLASGGGGRLLRRPPRRGRLTDVGDGSRVSSARSVR
jgi:signal transduction histidine kinase